MTNRNLREKQRRSKDGDVFASFELYQYFSDEDNYSEENLAQNYLDCCISFLAENRLLIKDISLTDFRKFKTLKIEGGLEKKLTVFIAENGQGKSSLLYTISKTLSWLAKNILKEKDTAQLLSVEDIRNGDAKYTDVDSQFEFGKKRISARLSVSAPGAEKARSNNVAELKSVSDLYRIVNSRRAINLPVFLFYPVERLYRGNQKRSSKNISGLRTDRFDAYREALDSSKKFNHFEDWFIQVSKRVANDVEYQYDDLKKQIYELRKAVSKGSKALQSILDEEERKLARYEASIARPDIAKKELMVVKDVVCSAVPGVENVWLDSSSGIDLIYLLIDGVNVKINQLSHGQWTYVQMVADIARRLVLLNPLLPNPLEGQGIVLIDEVELNLHPSWQQQILVRLTTSFPNIQFIVTTHSPTVLTTVDKKSIRLYAGEDEAEVSWMSRVDFQTEGASIEDSLERLMSTSSKPKNTYTDELNKVQAMIQSGSFMGDRQSEFELIFNKLRDHFGTDHPEIIGCQASIRRYKLSNKVAKIKEGK